MSQLLNIKQVAHLLNVHPNTVYTLVRAGDLEAKRMGRTIVVESDALQRYVDNLPTYQATPKSA